MLNSNLFYLYAFVFWIGLCLEYTQGKPVEYSHPKSQVEYISDSTINGPKPNIVTRPPLIINTPPPTDPNSKTFIYNAETKTWTLIKRGDPQPQDDALLWNQSNDKWLTKTPQ